MPKKSDDVLLLVLSDKEASILRNIVETPFDAESKARLLPALLIALVLATCLAAGLAYPELVRAIVESVMLLIL